MARSRPGRTVRAHRERGAKDRPGVDERVARRPATAGTGGAPRSRPAGPGPRRGRADRAPIAAIGPRRRSLVGRMESVADLAARRRTFAIISHPDAGKTTLTEKFLLYGG